MKAKGIAAGLLYLHDNDVIHADLKSDNILISDCGEPLLADFGISRIITSSAASSMSDVKGSMRWMATELLLLCPDETIKHTKQSDVWAYGMVLYELLTGDVPFAHLKNDCQVFSFALSRGEIPARPTTILDDEDKRSLGLPGYASREEFREYFGKAGQIFDVQLISKVGNAYIEFKSKDAAERCVTERHGASFLGRKLCVEMFRAVGRGGPCFRCGKSGHWSRNCVLAPQINCRPKSLRTELGQRSAV